MTYLRYLLLIFLFWIPLQGEEQISDSFPLTLVADPNTQPSPRDQPPSEKEASSPEKETPIEQATASYEIAFVKTIVVLVALLILVILTVWMFKRLSHGRLRSFNSMKSIKILEKRPLSPKSMLYLLEVEGKRVLIAESQFHVRHLTSLDWIEDKDL
jgi:flagellar biogenesis protein FliO